MESKPQLSSNTLIECTQNDILTISLIVTKQLNKNTKTHIHINNIKRLITEQEFDGKTIRSIPSHEFVDIAKKYNVLPVTSSEILNGIIHYFAQKVPQHSTFDTKVNHESQDSLIQFVIDEMDEMMNWMKIANCVEHEMYPKLANIIRNIIDDNDINIGWYDLDPKHIDEMITILKRKRNLAVEERGYLRDLMQRALRFIPITADNREKQSIEEDDEDVDLKNIGLNAQLLQDIFDIHRHFIFSVYHFHEYTLQQYHDDMHKAQLSEKTEIKQRFNFYPSYLIHDNIFEISDFVFGVSRYVHSIRNDMKHRLNKIFTLKVVIIPKSVQGIYEQDNVFPCDIEYIEDYLRDKNVFDYQRNTNDIDLKLKGLQNQYNIDLIERKDISTLLIIIDRRYSVDIMYMLSCVTSQDFKELNENYFLGFDFNVIPTDDHHNKVIVYLRYGINEKSRFYPEMMLSIVPRLFKKPSDIAVSDLLHKIYSHKYKHAFSLDLRDQLFNEYYKIITGFNHISVNINRAFLVREYSAAKEVLFFRDLLQYEMSINPLETTTIKETTDFIMNEDYDSEAIIDDVRNGGKHCSNIENYFISNGKQNEFSIIRMIVSKYTDPAECNKPKTCTIDNIFELERCEHICYLLETLITFNKAKFIVDVNEYNLCTLLEAYDHMIDVHQFNRKESNESIKGHFADNIGYCVVDNCSILDKHRMRRRERDRGMRNIDSTLDEKEDSLKEIISATLIAMHCYISHKEKHLFRLERSKGNLHFITPKDQDDEKTNSALSIKFGVSVLQWLNHNEKPTFSSFKEEIIKNTQSTISHSLYLNFAQECFVKMISRKHEQYTLDEMMSLKIYTDTDAYQSALRKAFWKTSSKSAKRSFYHWGMQLYKTSLFHSKPTPRRKLSDNRPQSLFHGLNMVFVLDNALPVYNGPLSTSWEESVAHSFSKGTGLLWTMQPSYANKFKFATGIDIVWISHHKNEAEFLLVNQYLPIVRSKNFDNDINNNVDHLLYSLKTFKKPITNADQFYRIIGLVYGDSDKKGNHCNPEWLSIIKEKKKLFLYQPTVINSKCVLERLVEELGVEVFVDQYKAISSKFQIIPHHAFNYYSIIGKDNDFNDVSCTIVDNDHNIAKEFAYNGISIHKVHDMSHALMSIHIKNNELFGCDNYIKIQDVTTTIFERCTKVLYKSLDLEDGKLAILQNAIPHQYHEEILECKYVLIGNDDNNEPRALKSDIIYNKDHYVYQFDDIDTFHFIVPYTINLRKLSLYVQFKAKYDFILFKTFDIDGRITQDNVSNQVDYLLNVLKIYEYSISSSNAFFKRINVSISSDHVDILKKHHLLRENSDSEVDNHLLNVLIDDFKIYQLLSLREQQTAKKRAQYEDKLRNIDIDEILEAKQNLDRIGIIDSNHINDELLETVQRSVSGIFCDELIGNSVVQVLLEQFTNEQEVLDDLQQYDKCAIIETISTEIQQNSAIKYEWNKVYDQQILYQLLQKIFRESMRNVSALINLFYILPSSLEKQQKVFQIVVSPPIHSTIATLQDPDAGELDDEKVEKVDHTLNGKISWKKVADFAALLPRDVKLKLWNGVFKAETEQHEVKRISKLLRVFVMLQLGREYKKVNKSVPNELKTQLTGAAKEPSKFIASFLKKDESFIENTLRTIYEALSDRFQTTDDAKKAKYAKKAKINEGNYAELTEEALKTEFNQEDFLKTAFLQYMIYAFQIELDMDDTKNNQ